MKNIKIYNTLGRELQDFKPIEPGKVRLYHCGPTVYWTQHLGNMRAMVLADLIRRVFEYGGYKVTMARNYTDVGHLTSDNDEGEDKMEKAAKREKLNPLQIAQKYQKLFDKDLEDLNCIVPEYRPKATETIKEMAQMVQLLLDKDYAYATDLAVYFDVSKAKDYAKLSGRKMEKDEASAGKGTVNDPDKKHPRDFALWFFKTGSHKNALQTWPIEFKNIKQPVEEGFPGWHIECSVMSQKFLGDTLDVHMGGVEHISVHHTNEIAQSEAATGKKFANYWLHNEHLTVDGGKMSKSEGTAYNIGDVKDKGYDPLSVRYFFCQAHYRSKQNFTWQALNSADTALKGLREKIKVWPDGGKIDEKIKKQFIDKITDDFNIPNGLAIVWELAKSDINDADKKATLLDFDKILGLKLAQTKKEEIPEQIKEMAELRKKARQDKKWLEADKGRDKIFEAGFIIKDTSDGYELKKK